MIGSTQPASLSAGSEPSPLLTFKTCRAALGHDLVREFRPTLCLSFVVNAHIAERLSLRACPL
jgi:hypothetical protein